MEEYTTGGWNMENTPHSNFESSMQHVYWCKEIRYADKKLSPDKKHQQIYQFIQERVKQEIWMTFNRHDCGRQKGRFQYFMKLLIYLVVLV